MPQPTDVPRWADVSQAGADPDYYDEPLAAKKNTGWAVAEKPAAQNMNWLFNVLYRWIVWVRDNVISLTDFLARNNHWTGTNTFDIDPHFTATKTLTIGVQAATIENGTLGGGTDWTLGDGGGAHGIAINSNTAAPSTLLIPLPQLQPGMTVTDIRVSIKQSVATAGATLVDIAQAQFVAGVWTGSFNGSGATGASTAWQTVSGIILGDLVIQAATTYWIQITPAGGSMIRTIAKVEIDYHT